MHSDAPGALHGKYKGGDAILGLFAKIHAETHGSFKTIPISFAVDGDNVFVETRVTGTRNGKSLDAKEVLLFAFHNDSIRDVTIFWNDVAQIEFWK